LGADSRFTSAVWAIRGRFTGATLGDSLSLSLARSPSYTHRLTGGLGHAARSFAHCLSVSRSLSFPLTLTLARSQSPSHSLFLARWKLPQRPRISAGNFPQGRRQTPKLDQREKRKKKSLDSGQISSESGGVSPESLLIRVSE
jgi:hypothetical protein